MIIVAPVSATHPPTRAYAATTHHRRPTKPEIIRCLKRYVARELYHALRADLLTP